MLKALGRMVRQSLEIAIAVALGASCASTSSQSTSATNNSEKASQSSLYLSDKVTTVEPQHTVPPTQPPPRYGLTDDPEYLTNDFIGVSINNAWHEKRGDNTLTVSAGSYWREKRGVVEIVWKIGDNYVDLANVHEILAPEGFVSLRITSVDGDVVYLKDDFGPGKLRLSIAKRRFI